MKNEPVRTAITTLVVSGLALLVAFGVDVTVEQSAAIAGFVAAVFVAGEIVRSKVTPTSKG